MAGALAARGLRRLVRPPCRFLPGDLFSMEGHIWLCVGVCRDESLVIAHSSPTPSRRTGCPGGGVPAERHSGARQQNRAAKRSTSARRYMSQFPGLESALRGCEPAAHLYTVPGTNSNSGLFRWSVLRDPEGYSEHDRRPGFAKAVRLTMPSVSLFFPSAEESGSADTAACRWRREWTLPGRWLFAMTWRGSAAARRRGKQKGRDTKVSLPLLTPPTFPLERDPLRSRCPKSEAGRGVCCPSGIPDRSGASRSISPCRPASVWNTLHCVK
ncbi:MAG: hypothetical protein ACLR4Z_10615 [Butyricicoccaceae bacterium]